MRTVALARVCGCASHNEKGFSAGLQAERGLPAGPRQLSKKPVLSLLAMTKEAAWVFGS